MSSDQPISVTLDPSVAGLCHIMASGHVGWDADNWIRAQITHHNGEAGAACAVALDISEVTLIDSAGISSLLTIHRELTESGGKLVLCAVPPRFEQMFEVVGMSRVIPVVDSLQGAREMFEL